MATSDLPALLVRIHAALTALISGEPGIAHQPGEEPKPTPTQIRKSITPEALISFIDGGPYKTLKRHLTGHGLDPSSYRQKYGLSSDYPMVAPSYSERRSSLAKGSGFGRGNKGQPK